MSWIFAPVSATIKSVHHSIVCGEARQGVLLDLDTDEGHPRVASSGELPLGGRRHLQPVAGSQLHGLAVQDYAALAGEDSINFLVLLVGVDEGDAGTGRELVDADLRTGET